MFWLFKDPVVIWPMNSGLAQFDHAQSKSKKVAYRLKRCNSPPMNLFLEKQLIKFPCTSWPLSFCKKLKQIFRTDPELWRCAIFGTKIAHLLLAKCFGTNYYHYFHLLATLFHCAKFQKILTINPEFWGCATFGLKMVHLPQTTFFWKIINIILI